MSLIATITPPWSKYKMWCSSSKTYKSDKERPAKQMYKTAEIKRTSKQELRDLYFTAFILQTQKDIKSG